eukprot:Gb_35561 [translate_table: standard]
MRLLSRQNAGRPLHIVAVEGTLHWVSVGGGSRYCLQQPRGCIARVVFELNMEHPSGSTSCSTLRIFLCESNVLLLEILPDCHPRDRITLNLLWFSGLEILFPNDSCFCLLDVEKYEMVLIIISDISSYFEVDLILQKVFLTSGIGALTVNEHVLPTAGVDCCPGSYSQWQILKFQVLFCGRTENC